MKIRCRTCFGKGQRLRKNSFELDTCNKCNGTGKITNTFDDTRVHELNKKILMYNQIERMMNQPIKLRGGRDNG